MASDTDSTKTDPGEAQVWLGGWGFGSIRARIMAVNLIAVAIFAIALIYVDAERTRLLDGRSAELARQAVTVATLIDQTKPNGFVLDTMVRRLSFDRGTRLRVFGADGTLVADNWRGMNVRRFVPQDPDEPGWRRQGARAIDRTIEFLTGAKPLPVYHEDAAALEQAWPAGQRVAAGGTVQKRAPGGGIVVAAMARVAATGQTVDVTEDADDLTKTLRQERLTSFELFLAVAVLTVTLSFYLIRTIVRPMRMLAMAAHRVRLGRAREVVVPRLPERRDELGALARGLSDMTTALRQRIDATEAFAADVAHELKNPLASLRSAVETLEGIERPDLRARLTEVIRDDVARLDRLITGIADASRLDAELSRSRFEPVDLGALASGVAAAYRKAGLPGGVALRLEVPEEPALVSGDAGRLAQVLTNLVDNAVSFSPEQGVVTLGVARTEGDVVLAVTDTGPGVPPANRDDVFRRFYSERPAGESFGRHSGLGLAIAKAIVEAHGGTIAAGNATGGGAAFTMTLPAV